MGDPDKSLSREMSRLRDVVCKDFLKLAADHNFQYAEVPIEGVLELGNDSYDGSTKSQESHVGEGRSLAVPHVDIDTIGTVADPQFPTGPLGGVGQSATPGTGEEPDLAAYDFGLTDADILKLLSGLARKQVAVIEAGAGTGKSTFLPYRLLLPPSGAALHLADRGPIVVTEPRRAAAINTATFVATKLHQSAVGAGFDVGYRVQDDPAYDANCKLLYVTDGSLINWLRDGSFKRFSTIIVDEAHERSNNIDIILGLLREALPQYPDLRLIVSSATIDASFFIEYFGGRDAVFHMETPTYKQWGYGAPLWPVENIDLSPWQGKFGPNGEDLQAITAQLVDLRVVDKPIQPGSQLVNWRQEMPTMVAKQVLRLLKGTESGDILAFLPSNKAINRAVTLIQKEAGDNVDVYALLSKSPEEVQKAARDVKADRSRRRVVVSTNIAETSLTIEDMTYVVDSGLINQSQWNVSTASKTIPAAIHSRDGVRQRWGRVGRKAPGWVFPLYTREQFDDPEIFPHHTPPQSTRDDLEQFLLAAKGAGVDAPESLIWPASFQRKESEGSSNHEELRQAFLKEMRRADRALRVRGALDGEGDMTALGSELRGFGGSMAHAIALILGDRMACAIEVATAILLLNRPRLIGTLLLWNKYWKNARRNEVRRLHEGLRAGCLDDLDLALKVYAAWEASDRPEAWAEEHAVSHTELMQIRSMREELLESLSPGRSKSFGMRPLFTELAPRVRAVFSRALIDQTYVHETDGWHALIINDDSLRWKIDPMACYTGGDRVIAMQREFTENGVLLSNLIMASDWAVHSGESWMSFALEATTRLQGVRGTNLREHLALLDEWRIGARYLCAVERESGEIRLRAIRRVDEITQQTAKESSESKSSLVAPQEMPNIAEELADMRELKASDTNEEMPEPSEYDYALSAPPSPEPSVPISIPRASTTDGTALPEGEVWVRVLGYKECGDARTLLVAPYRGNFIGDVPSANVNKEGSQELEVMVRAIEMVTRWGKPFLVTLEEQSGDEILMKPEELILNPKVAGVISIPPGARFQVTLTKQGQKQRTLIASRRTQLAEHLVTIALSDEWEPALYSARIIRANYRNRYVYIALEHGDAGSGIIHAYTIERSILEQAGIRTEPGTRLGVQLDLPLSEEGERLAKVETRKIPPGLEELLGDKLVKVKKRSILRCGALMPVELRDKLLALSSTSRWRNLIWQLWLKSTVVEIVSVQATTVDTLKKSFPPGQVFAATMHELAPRGGIYVLLEGGQRALARNDDIGPWGIWDAKTVFESERVVDVRILEITQGGDRGKPYIYVAIPDPPPQLEIAQKRFPLKSTVEASVKYVNDDKPNVLVELEGGQIAWAPKKRIGPEGVSFPSKYLKQGTSVTVVIDDIKETDEGEIHIEVSIPSANIPSSFDQLRDRFPGRVRRSH